MAYCLGNAFWGIKDQALFDQSMQGLIASLQNGSNGVYSTDQLLTWGRNLSFIFDKKFIESFDKNTVGTIERGVMWRRAVHYWAAQHCMYLQGDFVECGVWKGTTVHVIYDAVDFCTCEKNYWLYDIFDYQEGDFHQPLEGLKNGLYEQVTERFSQMHNIKIIRGYIPESFQKGIPDSISLLHIDMNNAPAELAALETLWDKVISGGIILLDDYGWDSYRAQKEVEDNFLNKKKHFVLELPTGQGILFKR